MSNTYNPSKIVPAAKVNTQNYKWTEKIKSTDPVSYQAVYSNKKVKK